MYGLETTKQKRHPAIVLQRDFSVLAECTWTLSIGKEEPTCQHRQTTDGCDRAENLADGVFRLCEAEAVDGTAEKGDSRGKCIACCDHRTGLGKTDSVEQRQAVQKLVLSSRCPSAHLC